MPGPLLEGPVVDNLPAVMTVQEVADYLRIPRGSVYKLAQRGGSRSRRLGGIGWFGGKRWKGGWIAAIPGTRRERCSFIEIVSTPKERVAMGKKDDIERIEAQQGERMIEVKIRFWTNQIAAGEGAIRPKHAWSSGVVRMERNKSHGIVPQNPVPFQSLMDLASVIERVLIAHGVVLHPSRRMQKYTEVSRSGEG
jgi:excisionase family DNA binding protein